MLRGLATRALKTSIRGNRKNVATTQSRIGGRRGFSEQANKPPKGSQAEARAQAAEGAVVLTPYQKVAGTARSGMYLGLAVVAAGSGYMIIKELMPTRMNPNMLFNEAADVVTADPDVAARLGTPMKAYGKDHGGKREGRRNFIEHVELQDPNDGTPRLRIKFNVKGPNGLGFGYAEVRKGMPKGEWVYLMVQMQRGGDVITIHDNRQILAAESQEESDALKALLGGSDSQGSESSNPSY